MWRGDKASIQHNEVATIDSTCGGMLADLGLASTAIGQSDLVDLGLEDLGLEKALSGDFDASSGEDENGADVSYQVAQPSSPPSKRPASDVRRGRPPKRKGSCSSQTVVASTTTSPSNNSLVPKKQRQKGTSICALPLTRSIADAVGIRLPDPIKEMVTNIRKQQSKKSVL